MRFCPRCLSVYAADLARCSIDGAELESAPVDPLIGHEILGYTVDERVGVGTTGVVYRAARVGELPVAIKILYGDLAASDKVVQRFMSSAEVASKIDHPGAVTPIEHGRTPDGLCYMVMPFVPGRTLATVLAPKEPLPVPRAASIAGQLASTLAAAHDAGCVHRDLKPMNVMLTRENGKEIVRTIDFGLVGLLEELARSAELVGTPRYLAPEVARDPTAASKASDLYALGVLIYEMLAGTPPFDGASVVDVIMKHTLDVPPPLDDAGGLEVIAAWLLEKDPSNRPETAQMVFEEIERLGVADDAIPEGEEDDDTLEPRPAPPMTAADAAEMAVTEDLLPEAQAMMPIVQPSLTGADAILGYEFLRGRFDLTEEVISDHDLLHSSQRNNFLRRLEELREQLEPGQPAADYVAIAGQLARLNVQIDEASEITES